MRERAAAFQNQPSMWLSTASAYRRSLPTRASSTGIGTWPLRKPGILTLSARSFAAWSTACFRSCSETSTLSRTRFSATSSTCACIGPFCRSGLFSGGDADSRVEQRVDDVDDEVEHDDGERDRERDAEDRRQVVPRPRAQRPPRDAAEPGQAEDRLDVDR